MTDPTPAAGRALYLDACLDLSIGAVLGEELGPALYDHLTPEEQKHIARTSVVRLRERMHFYANLMDPIHQPTATRLRDSANRIETPHE